MSRPELPRFGASSATESREVFRTGIARCHEGRYMAIVALTDLGQYDEAESMLIDAERVLQDTRDHSATVEELIRLYEACPARPENPCLAADDSPQSADAAIAY